MALYRYIAKNIKGKRVSDILDVDSRDEIVAKLKAKNLFIVSIEPVEGTSSSFILKNLFKQEHKKHKGIKPMDMSFFARNLAITLSAGVSLMRSLDIISVQSESQKLSSIIKEVSRDIEKGASLNEAIEKYPKVFPVLWTGIIKIGEASGNLPFVLDKLANYLEQRLEFTRKIKSALIYPVMVVVFSFIAMGVFFKFILPRFTTIFSQFHIKLPFITELLIKISDLVNNNFLLLVGFMVAIIVAFIKFRQSDKGKQILDRIKLIIPLIKGLVLYAVLERFSSTVYILLESGVPITYTLDVAAKSSGNSVIGKDIERVRDNVKKGKSFADELEKVEFFPPLISEIAKVGEEAGNMPEMFEKISEHYQLQLTTKMERLVAAFEPLVIFLLGGMIGVVVIALFMPIFKLVTLGGGGGGF
jgi:type IV pilus assembly protein PilC